MASSPKTKSNFAERQKQHSEGETADEATFAEMRSNILLIAGDHYSKKTTELHRRLRDAKGISDEQKIRLTKNHIQKIVKSYVNNITSYAPGVTILPRNESETQDQKAAQLHKAVWEYAKSTHELEEKVGDWADDFVGIGEVGTKIFWNPMAGPIVAYKQALDAEGQPVFEDAKDEQGNPVMEPELDALGQPAVDELGQPKQKVKQNPAKGDPIFRGDLEFEDFYAFNLLRPKGCKNIAKAPWLTIRKMAEVSLLKKMVGNDPDKLKLIQECEDKTFSVFDPEQGSYTQTSGQTLLYERFERPCPEYPNGYFYIDTPNGELFSGEIPFGIYPLIVQPFDKIQTSCRGIAIVKVARPYQVEINRGSSKMAEHQITLGDDKLLIQKGTKLEQGGGLPGIRGVTYTGKEPGVLAGRDGSQYLNYVNSQIDEMYEAVMLQEDREEKQDGQMDPMALLFKSASQKKKFSRYTKRFETFQVRVTKTYLALAKKYFPDDMLIPAIGRNEIVNIAEFRAADDLSHQIKAEPQSDDLESKFGKQLFIQHTLQYVGGKLNPEDIGKLLRASDYANKEEMFGDLTIDADMATNVILALDRGEHPAINKREKHEYMSKKLASRQMKPDYQMLDPKIQMAYDERIALHEQMITQQLQQLQAAEADYIPIDGPLVVVDFYVEDALNPGKTKRARLPFRSVQWLIQRIEQQGTQLNQLETMDKSQQASIAGQVTRSRPQGGPTDMGTRLRSIGSDQPQGVGNVTGSSENLGLKQPVFN
jgi:hypothetical protein